MLWSYKNLFIYISIYVRSVPVKRIIKLREKIRLLTRSIVITSILKNSILLVDRNLIFKLNINCYLVKWLVFLLISILIRYRYELIRVSIS